MSPERERAAVFLCYYSIGKSSPVICLLEMLCDCYSVDLHLYNVSHLNARVMQRINHVTQYSSDVDITKIKENPFLSYDHVIACDANGFALCKTLFPSCRPLYYSLELYFRDNAYNLHYPKQIMELERSEIHTIKGLIIQSEERETLFRDEYHLSPAIPTFLLPITYMQHSSGERSDYLRTKFNIPGNQKIALHLGGIQEQHCLLEVAAAFYNVQDWALVMHGNAFGDYKKNLETFIRQNKLSNVYISDDYLEQIEDLDIVLKSADAGIAWYKNVSPNFTTAGKSSGKISAYLRFGLPVIANKYKSTVEAIEGKGCGICVDSFERIPTALRNVEASYRYYSNNAICEYDSVYWFENYREALRKFIEKVSEDLITPANVNALFLNPTLSVETIDSFWVRKSILEALSSFLLKCSGIILDVGCGEMPYKPLILNRPNITEYIGLDIENPLYQQQCKPDLFWDGRLIPLEDASVDCAMATELFEHLQNPEEVMREIYRVLKPGGKLFFTVPFLWSLHAVPNDEYRYTPFSLDRHLKQAGFDQIDIRALGGWDASLAQMIGLWLKRKPMLEEDRRKFTAMLFPLYQQLIKGDTLPDGFPEGQMITGLSGIAFRPFTSDVQQSVPARSTSEKEICLAIVTPNIGTHSETFIKRHIQFLAPGKTVVITANLFDDSWLTCPYLVIPGSQGPSTCQPDVERAVTNFIHENMVTHILCEYGCYLTDIVELNHRTFRLPIFVHFFGGDASSFLRDPRMVEYYRWMGQQVTGVIAIAGPMAERLAGIGIPREKIHVVHLGIEIPATVATAPETEPCRFISVTRLVPKKGPLYTLQAFARARAAIPGIRLDIIGSDGFPNGGHGPMYHDILDFISSHNLGDSVTLHGGQPIEYVCGKLNQSSVYIQHSITDPLTGDAEGLPIIILEASAAGLPIVATRHEGIPEEVEHGITGFLVEEFDVDKMAEFMVLLAADPQLRKKMGLAARRKILREFDLATTVGNLQKTLGIPNDCYGVPPHEAPSCPVDCARSGLRLYAGDVPLMPEYDGWTGLSLTQQDHRHIRHDITQPLPLSDNSVAAFQAEDVLEHIHYGRLVAVINEIHRALKPGALFRLSVPDYGCDVLRERSEKDPLGNVVFDPGGGGTPEDPGHVWFPRIENVYRLLEKTHFFTNGEIEFLQYWNMDNVTFVAKTIDYSQGIVRRTPDFDERVKTPYRPMSLVVDLRKGPLTWQRTRSNILAYHHDWQYPVITELHAYERVCEAFPDEATVTYVGFPWATVIDLIQRGQTDKAQAYLGMLQQIPHDNAAFRITVAQHISVDRFQKLFELAGITDIFWPHATHDLPLLGNIRIHPFPLYPVRCLDEPELVEQGGKELHARTYLYSFVGAYDPSCYLTDVRRWIAALPCADDALILNRNEWHYEKVVYEEQVLGVAVNAEKQQQLDSEADSYRKVLEETVFSLCPSGSGPNSIRLWESLGYGCIPVILSDRLSLPGSTAEWMEAAIFVREDKSAIAMLPQQLRALAEDRGALFRYQQAGRRLWVKYGYKNFIHDLLQFTATATGGRITECTPAASVMPQLQGTIPPDPEKLLVSAIVSTYNSERYIRGCIEDLERQTIADRLEIIVIDSGSSEQEGEIVRELQKVYNNIRYIRTESRETVYAAWNRAINAAQGRYLANANTDDRHRADAFERMVAVLNENPSIDLVYADALITTTPNETFEQCTPTGTFNWLEPDRNALLYRGCYVGPQPLWRRSLHDVYGLFDPSYITSGDYEFWLRVSQTAHFHHIAEPLGLYLSSPTSIEHVNEDGKGRENARLLSRYRTAAIAGKLLGFMPFKRLRTLCASGYRDTGREKIAALVTFIDTLTVKTNFDSSHEAPVYKRVKEKILAEGPCSSNDLERFIRLAERLILGNTDWSVTSIQDIRDEAILQGSFIRQTLQRSWRHAMRGEIDTAVEILLQQGIKVASTDPAPYLALMELLITAGRYCDALEVVDQLPEGADPVAVLYFRAVCHEKCEEYTAAQQCAAEAFALAPDDARVLAVLGVLSFHRNEKEEATRLFEQAMLADPGFGEPCANLGVMKWSAGERESGLDLLERAVILSPLDNNIRTLYYGAACECGEYGQAEQQFAEDAAIYPDCRGVTLFLIDVLEKQQKDTEALERLEGALVHFGCADDLLDAALAVRSRVAQLTEIRKHERPTVSLCMIVKNEARNLAECLASVKSAVNEMIVVDTGSSDRTIDIATAFGAQVYEFAWNGNFSDARNYAIEQARGEWILALDADELLSNRDYADMAETLSSSEGLKHAWSVLTRNYTTKVNALGWTANDGAYPAEEAADGWHPSWKVRLFPNQPNIRFNGEVHEMVEESLRAAGYSILKASFVVHHYGGLEQDGTEAAEKRRHYFEIGMKKLERTPNDVGALAELAVQAGEMGSFEEAIRLWDRLLSITPNNIEAQFNKGYALIGLKRYREALVISENVLDQAPDHKEAAFNYGTSALYVGKPAEAVQKLEPLLQQHPEYPPLLAVLTLLYLLSGQREKAVTTYATLKALNYAITDYAKARADVLFGLGKKEPARKLLDECAAIGIIQYSGEQ